MSGARGDVSRSYAWHAVRGQGPQLRKLAQDVLKRAEELKKQGKLPAARARLTFTYLLDEACLACGASKGETGGKALEAIQAIDKGLRKSWAKQVPALNAKLDLVLRDKSVPEALQAIGRAAKAGVELLPGSVEDACALLRRKNLRVTYLDLRRATLAQALDWVLVPARMTWWVTKGTVVAGTTRRAGIESPWVYDVSHLALMPADELSKLKDHRKRIAAAQKAADDFLKPVRKALSLKDDAAVWFAPGELLIFGRPRIHSAAAKLFTDLADPNARLGADLATLHKATSARAEARKPAGAKLLEVIEQAEVIGSLRAHSWALLAAATAGELDLEALTELQVAWKGAAMPKLLKAGSISALRSLWAVKESARALPKEAELAALARTARAMSREAADNALAALRKSSENPAAFFQVLYVALVRKDDAAFVTEARRLLTASKTPRLAQARTIAAALLAPPREISRKALTELVSKGTGRIIGEDLVVLTALACHRAGGDAWRTFRAEARQILGRQPLPGSVVILVNRLASPQMRLLAGPPE